MRFLLRLLSIMLGLAALVPPGSAHAQFGTDEATLMYHVVEVLPGAEVGHCMQLQQGTLTAYTQLVGPEESGPVQLSLGISANVDAPRIATQITGQARFHQIPVEDGIYCFQLTSMTAPPPGIIAIGGLRPLAQYVGFRLVWTR